MPLDITKALESPLRSLHDGIVQRLSMKFGEEQVRTHSAAVSADTIARFSQGKFATWPVIGGAEGLAESPPNAIRMRVRWGIFVIAQTMHEVPDELLPEQTRSVPAVSVAETISNIVAQLAVNTRWGLPNDKCNFVPPSSLSIRNLGVGIKTAGDLAETEDMGLFVVWGENELDIGEMILPGDDPLPLWQLISGPIRDHAKSVERPEIQVKAPLARAGKWLAEWLRRLWRRPDWRPAWQHQAAAVINAAMLERFGAGYV